MGNPVESSHYVGFGKFELDLRTRELLVDGRKFDLQEQPFQVLSLLLQRPGELVSREELTKRLWPADTFVDFEHSLNRVIKRLREALDDSAEQPRFIETLPRRGYRFVATVRHLSRREQPATEERLVQPALVSEGQDSIGERESQYQPPATSQQISDDKSTLLDSRPRETPFVHSWRQRVAFLILVLGLGCLAGLLTFWLLSPAPILRISRSRQITTSGKVDPWGLMASDGPRIFFLEREGDHWNLRQTSVSGGESQLVPAPFRNTRVLDVSPDHSSLLIASFTSRGPRMPLWIWPVQGGPPKRLGEITAYAGSWCPNGRQILYSEDDGIYQIDVDGTNAHKFLTTDGHPWFFSWSPDSHLLRFTLDSPHFGSAIWQVDSDGTNFHRLLPGWDSVPEECCGSWSRDGEYFLFQSRHAKTLDIWAIREKTTLFQHRPAEPVRLTDGPIDFGVPMASTDGRKLFVLGLSGKYELVRYDLQSRQFAPLITNVNAFSMAYSRDGIWLAYTSSLDSTLVRVKSDGTEGLILTPPGLRAWAPRWSPDGKQLVFEGLKPDGSFRIFLASAEGGSPKELFEEGHKQGEPSWSPDGRFIAFTRFDDSAGSKTPSVSIRVFTLATNQVSFLPGSAGLRSPVWSPNGQFVAAVTENLQKLMLLDIRTQKWTELANATLLNGELTWSHDGKELYYQDLLGTNQPIYQIRLSDHKRELVTSFETVLRGGILRAALSGQAPDGSLIARLDRGYADIYSLDLETH